MAGVKDIQDFDSFKEILRNNERCLCVFHFSATWAPQCTQMNEVMQELSKDSSYGSLKFYKLEAEDLPEISEAHGISAVPTFIFIRDGKVVDRLDGANAAEFTKKVKLLSSQTEVDKPDPPIAPKEDLNTKLKRLINSEDVMLFMKGTPSEPCCGFSRQIVQILNDNHIKYGSFNILEDEEVRQGLKTYSNWPTYPQLYSQGELIGGLDIVKEMVENGELQAQLPKQVSLEDRLRALINEAPVMLFMKGDKNAPQCGFSKQAVAILNDAGANYKTFDILSNEEVRQGLKTFSDWPTYPQLYVNGELIGGLDIMKELKDSGELKSILKEEK